MHVSNFLTTVALALIGIQGANAWKIETWGTQDTCHLTTGAAPDSPAVTGHKGESKECAEVYPLTQAMLITNWDNDCKVTLYAGVGVCFGGMGTPVFSMTKKQASDQGLLSNDESYGSYMCKTGIEGQGPFYVTYSCKNKKGRGEGFEVDFTA
ncbi:putative Ecp2 effector protein domain-containing protein [Seiridium cardinale]|uniref:Ecp2 effector protein domain-containing protein n=1 Tax=Seiridium cardinale TaxID=138064 RepID=A0ABR2XJF9_9PEZI